MDSEAPFSFAMAHSLFTNNYNLIHYTYKNN